MDSQAPWRTKKDAGAGAAFGLFLTSGGLGYLFSVLHHLFHNTASRCWLSAVDHTEVVKKLVEEGKLKSNINVAELDRETAWVVVTAVWKEHLDQKFGSSKIRSADAYATALMDVVHSAGSVRIGAVFALLLAALFVFLPFPWDPKPTCISKSIAVAVGVILVFVHHWNYLCVGNRSERFINEVFTDALSTNTATTFVFQNPVRDPGWALRCWCC